MPPHRSGTIRLSPLQYGFPPTPPVFHPLPPPPSVLLTVARESKRDGTEDETQALHQALTPAHPSTSFCHAPAIPATLLSLDTPNSFLAQHLCTSCSFCQDISQGWHFCAMPVSANVSLPQESSPSTPRCYSASHRLCHLPGVPLSPFCFQDSGALFIPTQNCIINLFTTLSPV